MSEKVIPVLSKTIKTTKMPDIRGFIQAMKDMGVKVSVKKGRSAGVAQRKSASLPMRRHRFKSCLPLQN